MSQLIPRGKKGLYTYISDKGQWRATGTANLDQAQFLQKKWDAQVFNAENGRIDKNILWEEFRDEDYELYAPPVHEEKSYIKLKHVVAEFERIVKPTTVSSISFKEAERWLAVRSREVSPRTVNAERSYLRPLFERARNRRYTDENPFAGVKRIRVHNEKQTTLTVEDCDKFFRVVEGHEPIHSLLTLFAYETGMRSDEIAHQRMEDIDFAAGFIHANVHDKFCQCRACNARAEAGNARGFGGKCNSLPRPIPMSPTLQARLLERFQTQKTDCIFPADSTIRNFFKRNHERAGTSGRGVCVHTFRRTLATDMEEAGVRLSARKQILGHSQEREDGVTGVYTQTRLGDLHKEFQKVLDWREASRRKLTHTEGAGLQVLSA